MKIRKVGFLIAAILLAVFVLAFFLPTFDLLSQKWTISRAVANAKSIRLEEYQVQRTLSGISEKIVSKKDLAPNEIHKVSDAFPLGISLNFPGNMKKCLFDPHHRIIITDSAGKITLVRVCFICDAVGIGEDGHLDLLTLPPDIWKKTLRQFFADEGMPEQP